VEGAPGPHRHTKFRHSGFKNVGLQPQKSRKIAILGINLPCRKILGPTEKVEYRCTTTNLAACNDTIIVLIIILLHSVSVITNFVIPKLAKQTNRQKTSHFFVYSRHATHDPRYTAWWKRRSLPFLHPLTFFIRSVVSPLEAIENLRENASTAGKCL